MNRPGGQTHDAAKMVFIWVFDPERRAAHTASENGLHPVRTDELTVPGTPIRVILSALFAELDRG
ncbi:MAG TPA: hypothetical protein VGJ21_23865 [Terracidiphilus sp.]|jgi:hypothetical protein